MASNTGQETWKELLESMKKCQTLFEDVKREIIEKDHFKYALALASQHLPGILEAVSIPKDLKKRLDHIESREIRILIAGDVSAGKSTLMNILMGGKYFPVQYLSTTKVFCEVQHCMERTAVIQFKNDECHHHRDKKIPLVQDPMHASWETLRQCITTKKLDGKQIRKVLVMWPLELQQDTIDPDETTPKTTWDNDPDQTTPMRVVGDDSVQTTPKTTWEKDSDQTTPMRVVGDDSDQTTPETTWDNDPDQTALMKVVDDDSYQRALNTKKERLQDYDKLSWSLLDSSKSEDSEADNTSDRGATRGDPDGIDRLKIVPVRKNSNMSASMAQDESSKSEDSEADDTSDLGATSGDPDGIDLSKTEPERKNSVTLASMAQDEERDEFKIIFVDTPGITSRTAKEHEVFDEIETTGPLYQAFILVNDGFIREEGFQKLMEDIERSIVQRIYMMNPECALFITNKFDQVAREERHAVKKDVERKLLKKWPRTVKQNIIFMSASKEKIYGSSIISGSGNFLRGIKQLLRDFVTKAIRISERVSTLGFFTGPHIRREYWCSSQEAESREISISWLQKPRLKKLDNNKSRVKMADFGAAKQKDLICTHAVRRGTPYYWAPEIVKYADIRFHSKALDIYSLGLILWELWYRRHAYQDFNVILAEIPHRFPNKQEPREILQMCLKSQPFQRASIYTLERHSFLQVAGHGMAADGQPAPRMERPERLNEQSN